MCVFDITVLKFSSSKEITSLYHYFILYWGPVVLKTLFLDFIWIWMIYMPYWPPELLRILFRWVCNWLSMYNLLKFVYQENRTSHRDRWTGKVNFVEIRTFWHIFRSFDRMWSFFILALQALFSPNIFARLDLCIMIVKWCCSYYFQAMIIVAWNGSGDPSAIFEIRVFKNVLSIFITASILKLGQGRLLSTWFHAKAPVAIFACINSSPWSNSLFSITTHLIN